MGLFGGDAESNVNIEATRQYTFFDKAKGIEWIINKNNVLAIEIIPDKGKMINPRLFTDYAHETNQIQS